MKNRVNQQIRADRIVLIDETGKSLGIIARELALQKAREKELDLVEVAPGANPPVCKLLDYNKFLYAKEKERRKQRSTQKRRGLKEIRISLLISAHDLEIKKKKARGFLEAGHKIRVSLRLSGRENKFSNKAFELVQNFIKEIGAKIESGPKKEGNLILVTIYKN